MECDYQYKIVVIGESGTGKTQILKRLTDDVFYPNSKYTIGVEFGNKIYKLKDKTVYARLWDTAGQERYRSMLPVFYRGAHGVVLTFDLCSKASFERINGWLKEVEDHAKSESGSPFILLLGNKSDLKSQRKVSFEEGVRCMRKNKMYRYYETSAKSGENVSKAFTKLIKKIHKKELSKLEELKKEKEDQGPKYVIKKSENVMSTGEETTAKKKSDTCC